MIVQNEHWNGQPRPASKLVQVPAVRVSRSRGRIRRDRAFEAGQVFHIIVERSQRAAMSVAQQQVEPSLLRLAGENGNAQILSLADFGRQLRKHGEATGNMKAADADLDARRAQRARDVHRPRKLVRLDADEADQPATAVVAYLPDDLARIDPRVGFVIGAQAELDIVAQNLAGGRVRRKSVERRQGIGRHDRTEPLDDVTVVVIVRRLDENEMKYPRLALGRQCERHRYTSSASSRETGGRQETRDRHRLADGRAPVRKGSNYHGTVLVPAPPVSAAGFSHRACQAACSLSRRSISASARSVSTM